MVEYREWRTGLRMNLLVNISLMVDWAKSESIGKHIINGGLG